MAVETTKSRRDRLSMGHLLEGGRSKAPPRNARRRGQDSRCRRFIPGKVGSRAYSGEVESARAANSVCSLPPCGGGLGRGWCREILVAPPAQNRTTPTPNPSPSRLRACPPPANLKATKPRQAGVWLGRGAHRARCTKVTSA